MHTKIKCEVTVFSLYCIQVKSLYSTRRKNIVQPVRSLPILFVGVFTNSVYQVTVSVETSQKMTELNPLFPNSEVVFYYANKIHKSHTCRCLQRTSHAFVRLDSPPQKPHKSFTKFSFQYCLQTEN